MPDQSPAQVATALGIAPETLRKHAREFAPLLSSSAQGGKRARRMYRDADVTVLRHAAALLDTGLTYAQVRQRLVGEHDGQETLSDVREQDTGMPDGRHAAGTGVITVLNERPEVEALRMLLDAQRSTLEAQRGTLEAQSQLIAQLQQQHGEDRAALEQARSDEAAALASLQTMLRKIPRWLRGLLGLGA
jgi:DNA-binding transcriptional MerR regulator